MRDELAIRVSADIPGQLSCTIVDRDGFAVRRYVKADAAAGLHVFNWDGRDETSQIVADEAYSVVVRLAHRGGVETYAPALAAHGHHASSTKIEYYDRIRGVVAYKLKRAARVHLQAGTAKPGRDGKPQGVAMVNIVDSEPRPAGAVVEHWTGFDDAKLVSIPDLPHFVLSLVATELPENAVIAVGNTKRTFVSQARARRGVSMLPVAKASAHHANLAGTEDRAPALTIELASCAGTWPQFRCASSPQNARAVLKSGEYLTAFTRQPRTLQLYVDGDLVAERRAGGASEALLLPALTPGPHLITMNWGSDFGPLATASARVTVSSPAAQPRKVSR
ncbi:MAG TPA: hypothetical protein VE010_13945 [Thermoanaerobaculia bacterium]|nr:hypothetical protein [Thermoanaerobaculia bacterium]